MLTKNHTDIRSVKEVINKLSKYQKVSLAVLDLLYYAVFGWESKRTVSRGKFPLKSAPKKSVLESEKNSARNGETAAKTEKKLTDSRTTKDKGKPRALKVSGFVKFY